MNRQWSGMGVECAGRPYFRQICGDTKSLSHWCRICHKLLSACFFVVSMQVRPKCKMSFCSKCVSSISVSMSKFPSKCFSQWTKILLPTSWTTIWTRIWYASRVSLAIHDLDASIACSVWTAVDLSSCCAHLATELKSCRNLLKSFGCNGVAISMPCKILVWVRNFKLNDEWSTHHSQCDQESD